tara:strand:- start:2420 stop:2575 length:156 start_codon:yes stop_codon:yes gene_type:complete
MQASTEETVMSKERKSHKESKKKSTMTVKERKASKKSRQESRHDIFNGIKA